MQALQTGAGLTATPGEPAVIDVSPTQPLVAASPTNAEPAEVGMTPPAGEGEPAQAPTDGITPEAPVATQPLPPPATPTLEPSPLPTVEVARPQLTSQEIWRAQQIEREAFEQIRNYRAPGKVLLWWFDPLTRQHVALGWIGPEFQAQARFRLAGTWIEALEVPYNINQSFGLVLSADLIERIRAAGYQVEGSDAWIDTYVYNAPDMLAQ